LSQTVAVRAAIQPLRFAGRLLPQTVAVRSVSRQGLRRRLLWQAISQVPAAVHRTLVHLRTLHSAVWRSQRTFGG
jgi:hypothetical protein